MDKKIVIGAVIAIAAAAGFFTGKFYKAAQPAVVLNDHRITSDIPTGFPTELLAVKNGRDFTSFGISAVNITARMRFSRTAHDVYNEYAQLIGKSQSFIPRATVYQKGEGNIEASFQGGIAQLQFSDVAENKSEVVIAIFNK